MYHCVTRSIVCSFLPTNSNFLALCQTNPLFIILNIKYMSAWLVANVFIVLWRSFLSYSAVLALLLFYFFHSPNSHLEDVIITNLNLSILSSSSCGWILPRNISNLRPLISNSAAKKFTTLPAIATRKGYLVSWRSFNEITWS